jgi:hypothetical protein
VSAQDVIEFVREWRQSQQLPELGVLTEAQIAQFATDLQAQAGRADELLQFIDEALRAYGSLGRSDVTKAVHVESIAPTFV